MLGQLTSSAKSINFSRGVARLRLLRNVTSSRLQARGKRRKDCRIIQANDIGTMDKNPPKSAYYLKITQNVEFEFWHFGIFSPIFVLLKVTCLVTLFDRKLQVKKNSPKWTIFGIFN